MNITFKNFFKSNIKNYHNLNEKNRKYIFDNILNNVLDEIYKNERFNDENDVIQFFIDINKKYNINNNRKINESNGDDVVHNYKKLFNSISYFFKIISNENAYKKCFLYPFTKYFEYHQFNYLFPVTCSNSYFNQIRNEHENTIKNLLNECRRKRKRVDCEENFYFKQNEKKLLINFLRECYPPKSCTTSDGFLTFENKNSMYEKYKKYLKIDDNNYIQNININNNNQNININNNNQNININNNNNSQDDNYQNNINENVKNIPVRSKTWFYKFLNNCVILRKKNTDNFVHMECQKCLNDDRKHKDLMNKIFDSINNVISNIDEKTIFIGLDYINQTLFSSKSNANYLKMLAACVLYKIDKKNKYNVNDNNEYENNNSASSTIYQQSSVIHSSNNNNSYNINYINSTYNHIDSSYYLTSSSTQQQIHSSFNNQSNLLNNCNQSLSYHYYSSSIYNNNNTINITTNNNYNNHYVYNNDDEHNYNKKKIYKKNKITYFGLKSDFTKSSM